MRGGVIAFSDLAGQIPGVDGERNALALKRGTLDVRLVLPLSPNAQSPHMQDELYVVLRGAGALVWDGNRQEFCSGDLLFVAAGVEHHYENFTRDLALWRIFYGKEGGEQPDMKGVAQ